MVLKITPIKWKEIQGITFFLNLPHFDCKMCPWPALQPKLQKKNKPSYMNRMNAAMTIKWGKKRSMFRTVRIVGAGVKRNMRNEITDLYLRKKKEQQLQKEQCPGVEIDSYQLVHRQWPAGRAYLGFSSSFPTLWSHCCKVWSFSEKQGKSSLPGECRVLWEDSGRWREELEQSRRKGIGANGGTGEEMSDWYGTEWGTSGEVDSARG